MNQITLSLVASIAIVSITSCYSDKVSEAPLPEKNLPQLKYSCDWSPHSTDDIIELLSKYDDSSKEVDAFQWYRKHHRAGWFSQMKNYKEDPFGALSPEQSAPRRWAGGWSDARAFKIGKAEARILLLKLEYEYTSSDLRDQVCELLANEEK